MDGLFNLTWLIPIPPFLAFALILIWANPSKRLSAGIAIAGVSLSLLIGWPIAFQVFMTPGFGLHPVEGTLYTIPTGTTEISIGWMVDSANALMLFMVCFLLLMIFIYSTGYMTFPSHLSKDDYPQAYDEHKDPRFSRFMAYISLFACGMLGLVISNSLITFFVFWEVMGLCSYLLIGFWYEKGSARAAAVKAFMTTRVGDAIMLAGMLLLYSWSRPSSLQFTEVLSFENLEHLASISLTLPVIGVTTTALGLVAVLIFFGTIGKSAQFPLHVWLPDAMEGPTPVSALIHAATMVSAGVFLLIRMYPMFAVAGEASPGTMSFVMFIGTFTALFAATIAVAQWDIKRVLAYSTISQLGFMVAAVGMGAYTAALFHLITHAFFKGLLFLGSGSVIHGVEHGMHEAHAHGEHDEHESHHGPRLIPRRDGVLNPDDPQDMRNMGGLLRRMPITGWTFIIGAISLCGVPILTAGFWSKDEILASAWSGQHWIIFITLALTALLTAFYTTRQVMLTFFGKPRTEGAAHAPESTRSMTWPLILISPFALAIGWFGIPEAFPLVGPALGGWLESYLEPQIEYMHVHVAHPLFSWTPLLVGATAALGGIFIGWLVYGRGYAYETVDPTRRVLGPVWQLLHRKYYVDELYNSTIVALAKSTSKFLYWIDDLWIIDPIVDLIGRIGIWVSFFLAAFDRIIIDGVVNLVGWVTSRLGQVLRNTQDGQVQVYLLVLVLSVTIWLLLKALPVILTLV
jgi:NADH-quinone oxidoreductase subunit L